MKISGEINLYGIPGIFNVHVRQPQLVSNSQSHRTKVPDNREEFIRIQRQVVELCKALEKIDPSRFKPRIFATVGSVANATSVSDLGVIAVETAAVIKSTEEVNTTSTSFSPFEPNWKGSSTAQAIIGASMTVLTVP